MLNKNIIINVGEENLELAAVICSTLQGTAVMQFNKMEIDDLHMRTAHVIIVGPENPTYEEFLNCWFFAKSCLKIGSQYVSIITGHPCNESAGADIMEHMMLHNCDSIKCYMDFGVYGTRIKCWQDEVKANPGLFERKEIA